MYFIEAGWDPEGREDQKMIEEQYRHIGVIFESNLNALGIREKLAPKIAVTLNQSK